ncbi:MAG: hypothetical protein WAK31_07960 [Chthoniobacterales bacterium]
MTNTFFLAQRLVMPRDNIRLETEICVICGYFFFIPFSSDATPNLWFGGPELTSAV